MSTKLPVGEAALVDYNIAAVHAKNLWIDREEARMWIFCCSSFGIDVFETRVLHP